MHIHVGLPNLPATMCYHGYAYGVAPGIEQNTDGQTYWGELKEATQVSSYPGRAGRNRPTPSHQWAQKKRLLQLTILKRSKRLLIKPSLFSSD